MGLDTSFTIISFIFGFVNLLVNAAMAAALIYIAMQVKQLAETNKEAAARRRESE